MSLLIFSQDNIIYDVIVAVLLAGVLAYVIVKYIPLNLRWIPSILLLILAGFLGYKIYGGVMEPIKFNKEKIKLYRPVVENLKIIRDAQVRYFDSKGKYTKNKDSLINFVANDSIAIKETKTIVVKENRGGGVIVDVEQRKTDTIGYEPVIKYFKDRDFRNMFKVPGAENTEFELETGSIEKVQGITVSTFRARVPKRAVLEGMNESLVKQELEAVETDQIKGEYITVGSLEEVSTGGNWPPKYDKKGKKEVANQ